jgi:hypothetical protein
MSCQKIFKQDLILYPPKTQLFQELWPPHYEKKCIYCRWLNQRTTIFWIYSISMTKLGFIGICELAKYTDVECRKSLVFARIAITPSKIVAWVAISPRRLTGSVSFEESVTAVRY